MQMRRFTMGVAVLVLLFGGVRQAESVPTLVNNPWNKQPGGESPEWNLFDNDPGDETDKSGILIRKKNRPSY